MFVLPLCFDDTSPSLTFLGDIMSLVILQKRLTEVIHMRADA